MKPSLMNKHLYLMLTDTKGKKLKLTHFSIQDLIFKKGNKYDITCLAAEDSKVKKHLKRHGNYSVKKQTDGQMVLWCEEQDGQFKGEYEVTFKWINNKMGKMRTVCLTDGSAVNGIFQIAA